MGNWSFFSCTVQLVKRKPCPSLPTSCTHKHMHPWYIQQLKENLKNKWLAVFFGEIFVKRRTENQKLFQFSAKESAKSFEVLGWLGSRKSRGARERTELLLQSFFENKVMKVDSPYKVVWVLCVLKRKRWFHWRRRSRKWLLALNFIPLKKVNSQNYAPSQNRILDFYPWWTGMEWKGREFLCWVAFLLCFIPRRELRKQCPRGSTWQSFHFNMCLTRQN